MQKKKSIPPIYVGFVMFSLGLFVATLLNTGSLSGSDESSESPAATTLFRLQGEDYELPTLSYAAANALYQLEQNHHEEKMAILKRAALHQHLDNLAAKRGVSRNTIREELITTPAITDDHAAEFYEANRAQISQPYFQVKEAIKEALERNRIHQADRELIDMLEQAGRVTFYSQPPKAPSVELNIEGYPALGPETATVTIVDFADYKCPHCRIASDTLTQIQAEYPEQIRLVALELPILGKTSNYAAKAALCAHQQNQYWPLHKAMFSQQDNLTSAKITELAESLTPDKEQLRACLQAETPHPLLTGSIAQAQRLGLTGTPAIFINGIAYRGQNLESSLKDTIRSAVALHQQDN